MFSWCHFSLTTNCLFLKCCDVIPILKRRDLLLRMEGEHAQENDLFEDVSTSFCSSYDLSFKMQFWWYGNAENVLSPWGGSCFSGSVLLIPHYCNVVPKTSRQPCCAAARECLRWWRSDPGGFLSVLFWHTVEFLMFAFPSPGTSFFMELSFLGAGSPRAEVCFQVYRSNSSQT